MLESSCLGSFPNTMGIRMVPNPGGMYPPVAAYPPCGCGPCCGPAGGRELLLLLLPGSYPSHDGSGLTEEVCFIMNAGTASCPAPGAPGAPGYCGVIACGDGVIDPYGCGTPA